MKTILITGASGNLGKSTVEKFLTAGHRVLATVSPGKTNSLPSKLNLEVYEADLTNEASAESAVQKMIATHKSIDVALLLAGGFAAGGIKDANQSALSKMYSLNFETAYFVARPVFLQMQTQSTGGRIVLVGARPALKAAAGKGLIAYALSKSLLFRLAEYLNEEGLTKNVVTSVIVPSTIDTPANRESMPKADFSSWVTPEQIAEVLEFLSTEKGSVLREPVVKIYGNS